MQTAAIISHLSQNMAVGIVYDIACAGKARWLTGQTNIVYPSSSKSHHSSSHHHILHLSDLSSVMASSVEGLIRMCVNQYLYRKL